MKKIIYLFILLLFPFTVNASYGIENYRIDITVLENGNLSIEEAFSMNGSYNGFERIIDYKGSYSNYSGPILSPTGDNSIYEGSGIDLKEIRGINSALDHFSQFRNGDLFKEVNSASKGQYGVYTTSVRYNGETYLIYNPSKKNKDFYLKYELEGKVIIHNDIAEVGLNIFTSLSESVRNLEIYIHIPNNKDILRVWAHGPLHGESRIVDNQTLLLEINGLNAYEAIDTRFVFDKDVVKSSKKTNIDALEKIINIETELAEEANAIRELYYKNLQRNAKNYVAIAEESLKRDDYEHAFNVTSLLKNDDELKQELSKRLEQVLIKVEQKEQKERFVGNILCCIYFLILGVLVYNVYHKHDKEYKNEFTGKYYRDIPCDYDPSTVGYLMRKKVNTNDLSAGILNLIYKKKIAYEPLDDKHKNYLFRKLEITNLNEVEKKLMEFLFDYNNEIELKDFKKRASLKYSSFIADYNAWINTSKKVAKKQKFYEEKEVTKLIGIVISILGIFVSLELMNKTNLALILLICCIVTFVYMIVFTKRTKFGSEQYAKWNGLKKFMEDFGKMDDKELPEIELWEKYLVYAVTLGCADKLAKTMKVKIEQMNLNNQDIIFDTIYYNDMLNFNRIINNSVNAAVSSAYSAQAAASSSSSSSGGGFGGGFSGGGGGFSGGGGGGRF